MSRVNRNERWYEGRNRYQQEDQHSQWHDNYRGYDNPGYTQRDFASNYNAAYGDQANRFGYGGHYGAGGNYGSFGGPASSHLNIAEQLDLRNTGGHRGKGPRGYHRSDERILEDVNDRLSDDAYLDASEIDVKIENGTIILGGHVSDKEAKRRAEDIAESVQGVNNVENRLHIGKGIMEDIASALTAGIGSVTVGHDQGRR